MRLGQNELRNGLSDSAWCCDSICKIELNGCQIDHHLENTFIYPIRVEDLSNREPDHRLRGLAIMMVAQLSSQLFVSDGHHRDGIVCKLEWNEMMSAFDC